MELLYKNFVREHVDQDGLLRDIEFVCPDNFNFAFDVLDVLAARTPDALALQWCDEAGNDRSFTFAEMARLSAQAASAFAAAGVGKGDRVMLVLKRHFQYWYALMGLCRIGALAIPATHLLSTHDLTYRFRAAQVSGIVCTGDGNVAACVDEAMGEYPGIRMRMMSHGARQGWDDFDALVAEASPDFPRPVGEAASQNADKMLMYFTSGTTGMPKMVWHDFTYPLAHIITARYWHGVIPGRLHLTVADTGWAKAVWGKLYGQWLCEAPVFVYDYERFHADTLLKIIEKYRIGTFCAPPTIYRFFIAEDLHKYDLSCLAHATIAGEALNPEVYNAFLEATGLKLREGYGQTETTLTVFTRIGMEPKPGSMGRPSPAYHTDLVDAEGNTSRPGEVGEIVLRIPEGKPTGMFGGYYKDDALTGRVWHDGLYHTGDMAWRDEDNYFWFVGRTDDLIKSSGYRIGPFEVESVLMEHDAVLECAVTGAPDPVRGQVVKATIVLNRGWEASDALAKELQDYVKSHTASYKYPRIVEFTKELPKTISGKIRRTELRDKQ